MPKEVSEDAKTMQSHLRSRMNLVMAVFMTLHVQILIARAMEVEQDVLAAKNAAAAKLLKKHVLKVKNQLFYRFTY